MKDEKVFKWLEAAGAERPVKFSPGSDKVQLSLSLIQEELDELKEAVANSDKSEMIDAIVDLNWVINNAIYFSGITETDLRMAYDQVLESNWSKFCKSKEAAMETCKAYYEGTHPDKLGQSIECYFEENGIVYVIKRCSDDKIMKSLYYKRPMI